MNTKGTQFCEKMLLIAQKTAVCVASVPSWKNFCPKCSKIVNICVFLLIRQEYKHITNVDYLEAKKNFEKK